MSRQLPCISRAMPCPQIRHSSQRVEGKAAAQARQVADGGIRDVGRDGRSGTLRVVRTADPAGYRMTGQAIERNLASSMFRGLRPADAEVDMLNRRNGDSGGWSASLFVIGIAVLSLQAPLTAAAEKAGGANDLTRQVQQQPSLALPSLNPLVERVLPAVVSVSAQFSAMPPRRAALPAMNETSRHRSTSS
jgi:hypothetical protein